jgi:hypothetical protein
MTMITDDKDQEYQSRAISCTDCVWRHDGGVTCDAFPQGVPLPILLGVFDHTYRYEVDGVDDGGITRATVHDL